MTDEDLDAIRQRLAAATPGPWQEGDPYTCTVWNYRRIVAAATTSQDAALIAHAPADIANLLAEVERLRAEVAQARPAWGPWEHGEWEQR